MKIRLLLIVLTMELASCAQEMGAKFTNAVLDAETKQQSSVQYLAYEHELKLYTESSKVSSLHDQVISLCTSAEKGQCILLDSSLSSEEHENSAYIKLRLQRELVKKIVEAVSTLGIITKQNTHIEDLASSIADGNKRLQFLKSYQNSLIELQKQPNKNIDSLLKTVKEIASVQSDIEQATAEINHLLSRVNLDILTITITSYGSQSFWFPVSISLSSFSKNLSRGLSDVINASAYFLPWFIVFMVLVIIIRKLWRRK